MVTRANAVTMADQKNFIVKNKFFRFKINRHIQFFLEVVLHPHIVVAYKKMNLYSRISKFCDFSQQAHIAPRNHLPVFIPEIKHITYNENGMGIVLYFI